VTKLRGILLALALVLVVAPRVIGPQETVTPSVITAPAAGLQDAVKPVTTLLKGHAQAAELGYAYAALADTVQRDAGVIKTTRDFKEANTRFVTLRFAGILTPKVPGLAAAIDQVLQQQIGLEVADLNKPRTDGTTLRASLVSALNAVAWACLQAK